VAQGIIYLKICLALLNIRKVPGLI
jgi:hypothetical protein